MKRLIRKLLEATGNLERWNDFKIDHCANKAIKRFKKENKGCEISHCCIIDDIDGATLIAVYTDKNGNVKDFEKKLCAEHVNLFKW